MTVTYMKRVPSSEGLESMMRDFGNALHYALQGKADEPHKVYLQMPDECGANGPLPVSLTAGFFNCDELEADHLKDSYEQSGDLIWIQWDKNNNALIPVTSIDIDTKKAIEDCENYGYGVRGH